MKRNAVTTRPSLTKTRFACTRWPVQVLRCLVAETATHQLAAGPTD